MPKVMIEVSATGLDTMRRLQARLGAPNLATALYNAVTLVLALYDSEDEGKTLQIAHGDTVTPVRLHRATAPTEEE